MRASLLLAAASWFGLLAMGRFLFWGDLTYIHQPWRALVAEQLQRGLLPHWNPFAYLGMPLAAQMQSAAWYPGSLPFYFFPFPEALTLFQCAHMTLAGFFGWLWLRREGFRGPAARAGAVLYMANGMMIAHLPYINHLSSLAYLPACLLFRKNPWLLGLTLALCFLSGYPTMAAGAAFCAIVVPALFGRLGSRKEALNSIKAWVFGGLLAAGLSAVLLLPAYEVVGISQRGAGMPMDEILEFGFKPSDWKQWLTPALLAPGEFSPGENWWVTAYLGAAGAAAAIAGLVRLPAAALAAAAGYLVFLALLLLGKSLVVSRWLWEAITPLQAVRYPGNLSFLVMPVAAWLAAFGLRNRKWAAPAAILMTLELFVYALFSHRTAGRDYFFQEGPLNARLHALLGDHRYLLAPSALLLQKAQVDLATGGIDLNQRLYGLTNVQHHFRSVANFGEPLVPHASYRFMDFIYRRKSAGDAAEYMPWADATIFLSSKKLPKTEARLTWRGEAIWNIYAVRQPTARALWLSDKAARQVPGEVFPEGGGVPLPRIDAKSLLPSRMPRPDRYSVSAATPAGWLFLAEPRVPGWTLRLSGAVAVSRPALSAFQLLPVPAGRWTLDAFYQPPGWLLGVFSTVLVALASGAYWYNRAGLP